MVWGGIGLIRGFPGEKGRGSGVGWGVKGGEGRPWEVDWRTVLLLALGLVLVVVRGAHQVVRRAGHLRPAMAKVFQSTDGQHLERVIKTQSRKTISLVINALWGS